MALSIESIDEQFIARNTEDYDLVIDITGNPDTVEVKGHMEGFIQDWDAVNGQLHIKSDKVTRLISGVNWDIDIRKGMQTLMRQIAYNVIEAAPIFETLGTIHLYRGVPINFDIVIQNIPPLLIPNARLLGLKSDLVEYGVSVKGEIGTTDNFTINTGNVRIIVPSESGGDDTVYDFPYQIEAGSPPAIGTPEFIPRGNYGKLEVADVTHALGYEWTLQEGDEATWNFFSNSRNVIDPATVEVTPGNLNVTIKFPNIAGASSYEYQLVSEDTETLWKRFTGTLSNNMITTIIPDLEEGVQYTLRLRVASPWVGAPISVTVYGGRLFYVLPTTGSRARIVLSHTGVPAGGVPSVLKTILLPSTLSAANSRGLAVDGTTAYVFHINDVFVFDIDVNDGNEATQIRRFRGNVASVGAIDIREDVLYVSKTFDSDPDVRTISALTANGATATIINTYDFLGTQGSFGSVAVAVNDEFLVVGGAKSRTNSRVIIYPRLPSNYITVRPTKIINIDATFNIRGIAFSGDKLVVSTFGRGIWIFSPNFQNQFLLTSTTEGVRVISNPVGIDDIGDIAIAE